MSNWFLLTGLTPFVFSTSSKLKGLIDNREYVSNLTDFHHRLCRRWFLTNKTDKAVPKEAI